MYNKDHVGEGAVAPLDFHGCRTPPANWSGVVSSTVRSLPRMSHPRPPVLRRFYEGEHPGGTNWSPPGARQSPPVGGPQFPRGSFHDPMDDRPPYPGNFPWDVQKSCIPDRPGGAPGPRHRHGPQRSRKRLPKPAAKVVKPLSKPTTSVSVWTVQVGLCCQPSLKINLLLHNRTASIDLFLLGTLQGKHSVKATDYKGMLTVNWQHIRGSSSSFLCLVPYPLRCSTIS